MFDKKGKNHPRIKYIYHLESPSGEIFETYCINDFCKSKGMNRVSLYRAYINNRTYKGWKLERKEL